MVPNNTPTRKRNIGGINLGRRANIIDGGETPAAAKKAKTPQKTHQQTSPPTNNIRIKKCTVQVKLFPEPPQNRRMTPQEYEDEILTAKIWGRVPRDFIFDHPTYPYVPTVPKYSVNFDLNAPQ
nr:MAG: hypothetical protein [Betatorquevirus sp.]